MLKEMDRMEDRVEHIDLRHVAREPGASREGRPIFAEPEDPDAFDLRKRREHRQLREDANLPPAKRRPAEIRRQIEKAHLVRS